MDNKRVSPLKVIVGYVLTMMVVAFTAQAQPASAQSEGAPDEQTKAMNYSLYWEEFKNGNYSHHALSHLKWILEHAPAFPRNDDRNFKRLVEAYDSLSARADDPSVSQAYLDSALSVFDTAVPALKQANADVDEFEWVLEKARFIQSKVDDLPEAQAELISLYEKAYALAPERLQDYYLMVLVQTYSGQDKQKTLDFMDELEGQFGDRQELMSYITQARDALFTSPEERMAFLEERRLREPDNMDLVNELFDIYRELRMRDKMYEIGEELLTRTPTSATYRIIAKLRLDDGEAQEAFDLYQKALDMPGAEARVEDYYNMGIAQQQLGSLSRARQFFRRALEVNPNYGRAHIAIGDLYVTSVSNCGSFEREDKAVYWLAVDYYEQARQRDPSVAAQANQKINTYRRSFPNAEDMFFRNWSAGQSYRIDYGCYQWVNEATTMKAP
jgi:hypothetical protein